MPVLQRIRFPETPALQALYFRADSSCKLTSGKCTMEKGAFCSLDSFYNACFFGRGGWPSSVGVITCTLVLEGDFHVSIVFRSPTGRETPLHEHRCEACTTDRPQSFLLPERLPGTDGRLFPVVRSLSDGSTFRGGIYVCDRLSSYGVHLGVVICTYNREKPVLSNLDKLAADPALKDLQVVVVDNGRSIEPSRIPDKYSLLPNPNQGGAGGFSRGLIELAEQGSCTHVLLMDDDVLLDTEAVLRCINFFLYAPEGALAGALLSLEDPCIVEEAGANLHPVNPLVVVPHLLDADLGEMQTLDSWQQWQGAQYGGFWFFAFPMTVVRDSGALLPFFLKGDDIEFGLRLGQASVSISLQAGVGVHHPGFTGTFDLLKRYCWVRNMMIVRALYNCLNHQMITGLFLEVFKELRSGRRDFLLTLVRGLEDFLKGPMWLGKSDAQLWIESLYREARICVPVILLWTRAVHAIFRILLSRKEIMRFWRSSAKDLASFEYWKQRSGS